jgi:hypothetical protein
MGGGLPHLQVRRVCLLGVLIVVTNFELHSGLKHLCALYSTTLIIVNAS